MTDVQADKITGKKQRKKFLRYEWFKCKKLGLKWRRPVGLHSKVRQGRKGKPPQVNAGFGHARATRGFVNGVVPAVVIQNMTDLERVAAKTKTVIIASGLGMRAANEIAKKAEQLGVTILNAEKLERAQHRVWTINKQREDRTKAKTETKTEAKAKPETKPEAKVEAKPVMKPEVTERLKQEVKTAVEKEVVKAARAVSKSQSNKG